MKFEYNWTRNDLKKDLRKRRLLSNIILFVLAIVIYIYIMYNGIESNLFDNTKIYLGILLFSIVTVVFLAIFNEIYVCFSLLKNDRNTNYAYGKYKVELTDKIRVQIKKDIIEYNYNDIKKFKHNKNIIFINTNKDKMGLIFKRKVIGDKNFDKMTKILLEKIGD